MPQTSGLCQTEITLVNNYIIKCLYIQYKKIYTLVSYTNQYNKQIFIWITFESLNQDRFIYLYTLIYLNMHICNNMCIKYTHLYIYIYIYIYTQRHTSYNGYICRKWNCRFEFKSSTSLFAFHFILMLMEKTSIHSFSLLIWMNSWGKWVL